MYVYVNLYTANSLSSNDGLKDILYLFSAGLVSITGFIEYIYITDYSRHIFNL